ncbi:FtsX-like permease family protein [Marinilactibacillus piezotolerans]|uniref:FtsX-like permease family protein n=1 Tax=Marinilactibacillus piezotolerans TaxID=258723 RepID=UPI0009B13968|nr:FtsX-like permease family protein [Marinilactibacillus piezotolerans]
MKKKALWKDTVREIIQTKTRFLSIFAIILLGVAFFAGISATGPVMVQTADDYYHNHQLMDLQVQSTLGLNDKDLAVLNTVEGATVESLYSTDVVLHESGVTSKIYGLDPQKEQALNQYIVTEGRLPENSGEIALDTTNVYQNNFQIGDTVQIESGSEISYDENFKTLEYEVVGFVISPLYVESDSRGNTPIGSGTLDGFSVILEEDFDLDYHTETFLRFNESVPIEAYTSAYDQLIERKTQEVESLLEDRPQERLETLKAEGQQEIDEGYADIEAGEQELEQARADLEAARAELDEGWAEYEEGVAELEQQEANARTELESQRQTLAQGRAQLETAREELEAAQAQINSGREQLAAEREAAEARFAEAEQQISSGRQQLEQARQALEAEAQRLEANAGSLPEAQLAAAQESLANQRAQLQAQAEELNQAEVQISQGQQELANAQAELEQSQREVDAGLAELEAQEAEIQAGAEQLTEAEAELESELAQGREELAAARAELEDGEEEYEEGLAEFEQEEAEAEAEIADAREELEQAQEDLDSLEAPEYLVNDRSSFAGYEEYGENAERISSIAQIFPVFFFLLAALISLTTMTRMVDEGRNQIGTLKALGYTNRDISMKYFVYAFLATIFGAVIGLGIGYWIFPSVIIEAYSSLYNLPGIGVQFYWSFAVISIIGALLATGAATLISVRLSLQSNASDLLRPKAPKKGKRILLERIPFLWNRFSFTQKVSSRNLFRYKGRMLMTIIGVAGCTALLLTGFGLSDSISNIGDIQYGEINQYQAIVSEDPNAAESDQDTYEETLNSLDEIDQRLAVEQNVHTAQVGDNTQDVNVFVPQSPDVMEDFVVLKDYQQSEKVYDLPEEGAVITQKLADLFNVSVGDSIQINGEEQADYDVEVKGIVEHYFEHYVYLSPSAYEIAAGEAPEYNIQLLKYDTDTVEDESIGQRLIEEDAVLGVIYVSTIYNAMQESLGSLDVVTIVIIVSAAALAFIVLYNLTNINVSERERELSTIKVLGFYDKEVTMYVYRENIVLTLMGILFGLVLGIIMHRFVLQTAEIDMMRFSRHINLTSYLYSGLLTFLFSGVVMILMHFKLKYIDMIEALKAQE